MKYSDFQYDVDSIRISKIVNEAKDIAKESIAKETLIRIFSLLDLTSLSELDNEENVTKMVEQVNNLQDIFHNLPAPASICVYPELVSTVRTNLINPRVNITSVAGGFPSSQTFLEVKLLEVEMALIKGANEIDIVMPLGKFILGKDEEVFSEIKEIKNLLGNLHLKVILETGSLRDLYLIRKASLLSMDAGADFIKTSTGKASSGADTESFAVMCLAIKDFYNTTGKKKGIKPAGGISDFHSAYLYYSIVKIILGEEWLNPKLFRIGASRLANNLIQEIFKKNNTFNYFH